MPLKQLLADHIVNRYLEGYNARMRIIRPRFSPGIASPDPTARRDGLVLLHDAHDACHEGAFNSMRLKPTDWNAEVSAISLALTLDQAKVSLPEVEFALLERDTAKIEELSKVLLERVVAGFVDAPDNQFTWRKGLTLPQRVFRWHHAQWINVGNVIRQVHDLSPRAERLAENEGMPDILARLGTAAGRMGATFEQLTQWLDSHIDDQAT